MNMKSSLSTFLAMSAMMGETFPDYNNPNRGLNPLKPKDINLKQVKIIPKGCEEYYFNSLGEWDTSKNRQHHITRDETVFITVASSTKKAIEKFNKHQSDEK